MAREDSLLFQHSELRIVLVGMVGAEKTSVMNKFLRSSEKPACDVSDAEMCQKVEVKIGGLNVVVVDTPGLCNTDQMEERKAVKEIPQCVLLAAPGPHVFLFVISCLDKSSDDEQHMVDIFKKTFGNDVLKFTMVLFTHGEELREAGKTIQELIEGHLKNFVNECKGGCNVIVSRDQNPSHVTELLKQINFMVQKNEGKFYTTAMLPKAEKKATSTRVMKKVLLSVNGSAVAGAGLGGAVAYFVGSTIGIPIGAAAGAVVGGTLGGVGLLAAEHIKAKGCMIQ